LITSDLPIVACSWLLTFTVLRGAGAGVGSAAGAELVLTAGFTGSGVVVFGAELGELAGFHITDTSFRESYLGCSAASIESPSAGMNRV
jgi:hypothetical protein